MSVNSDRVQGTHPSVQPQEMFIHSGNPIWRWHLSACDLYACVICVPEVCLRVIGVFVILERDVREISLCMIGVVICEV